MRVICNLMEVSVGRYVYLYANAEKQTQGGKSTKKMSKKFKNKI